MDSGSGGADSRASKATVRTPAFIPNETGSHWRDPRQAITWIDILKDHSVFYTEVKRKGMGCGKCKNRSRKIRHIAIFERWIQQDLLLDMTSSMREQEDSRTTLRFSAFVLFVCLLHGQLERWSNYETQKTVGEQDLGFYNGGEWKLGVQFGSH